ncbi:hypothetical protein EDB84DRAFT_1631965 [Lactarius hengduanensis]|nr:hypothetical protein EDB84DRAFT_1631965 [Lactarius hengduanensis]
MFDVKKRQYFDRTSMEAEISLLMANQTGTPPPPGTVSPGKLIYDPYTGSLTNTTAHFGAFIFGSDIDGRQMQGKETNPGILHTATQYRVRQRILDLRWRPAPSQQPGADDQPYLPPTKPYELSPLAADLVRLARYLLNPGGRPVFFVSTVIDEYKELDLDSMLCDGMEVVANSLQDYGAWGRRLITIRKSKSVAYPPPTYDSQTACGGSGNSSNDHDSEDASPAPPVHAL